MLKYSLVGRNVAFNRTIEELNNLKITIMKSSEFLLTLSEYPQSYQITEASDYAQDKAIEYLKTIDPDATLTVEDGEVYCQTDKDIDEELIWNVQVTFDEAFGEKIWDMGFRE